MTTAIILQARMNSTRLPGKVLLPVMGRPILAYQLERLRRVRAAERIVIATTVNSADQEIVDLAVELGFSYFRGSESDVLSRYYHAAQEIGAQTIVRCNADCPLIDPEVVDSIIGAYKKGDHYFDYVSNILCPTYPTGMHTEVFSYDALEKAFQLAQDPLEREHVTPYIYRRPAAFRLRNIALDRNLSHHRWTLDFPEDLKLISLIYEAIYPTNPAFGMEDVIKIIAQNPAWAAINGHIQKNATV